VNDGVSPNVHFIDVLLTTVVQIVEALKSWPKVNSEPAKVTSHATRLSIPSIQLAAKQKIRLCEAANCRSDSTQQPATTFRMQVGTKPLELR
jgi:hypothetical protein